VGVSAVVIDGDGRQLVRIDDPAGGTFDAAGDFDRLLDRVPDAIIWSTIDPDDTTTFGNVQAASLLRELPAVARLAREGSEQRGLARLAVLARLCASDDRATLRFVGD
jgi:hypothetical protein